VKALVFDVDPNEIIHLIQEARGSKEAYLGEHALLRLEEVPDARIPFPDWVLLQTRLTGICGSDYKQVFVDFEGYDSPMAACATFPQVMGHEVVGTVAEIGAQVKSLRVGQRVVLNPWLSCAPRGLPLCSACRDGQYSVCSSFRRGRLAPGVHIGNCRDVPGGFAPYLSAHHTMAIPIPDEVSDDEAVLADPFSVSLHSVLRHPPQPGDLVVVYGCGTLGLCAIEILNKLFDAEIYAITRFEHQAKLAKQLGAVETLPWRPIDAIVKRFAEITGSDLYSPVEGTGGLPMLHGAERGVRIVYNTVGTPESWEVSVRIAAARGTVVISGVDTPSRFEWSPHYFKEINLVGSNAFGVEEWNGKRQHAMLHYFDLIRDRHIDMRPIITHRFRIEEYKEAFRYNHEQDRYGAVKVLFDFR
jgi:threonine dehydrogenase-like Zn-dependent dehydrogenase